MSALVRLTTWALLVVACVLGVASLIFAVWAVPVTGTKLPAPAFALGAAVVALAWISIVANTVITAHEMPTGERDPLAVNAALYKRFVRRSSRGVRAILATVLVLATTLGTVGIATSAPVRLMAGMILSFSVIIIAMLVALLPSRTPASPRHRPCESEPLLGNRE